MKKEIILYNDDLYEYMDQNNEAITEYLNDNKIEPLPNEKEDAARLFIEWDAERLNDFILNFDLANYSGVLVVASLGLWYGRREASKTFKTLKEAFYKCCYDVNKLYFKDKRSTLNLESHHHDGVNYYKFYKIVNGKKYAIKYNELATY